MIKKYILQYQNMSLPLKAGVWFFICNILQKGISVITTPIFTRLLSTSEYGTFNIFMSWRDLLAIFITFGLSSSVYQKRLVELNHDNERRILTSSLQGLAMTTATISFLIYCIFHQYLDTLFGLSFYYVVAIYISVIMTTSFDFWAMRKRVDYSYKPLVILTLIVVILKPLISIIMILLIPSHKIDDRIYSIVFVEVAAFLGILIKQFYDGKVFFHKANWKYAMVFVLPLIPHFLSQRILNQSDKIMINSMVGSEEAGIYSLAHSVGWLLTIVVSAFDSVLAPWIYKRIKEGNLDRIRQAVLYPLFAMAIACFVFIIIGPEMVKVFATRDYFDAVWTLPPFVLSTFLMLLYSYFIYFEYYYEKTQYIMIATIASALLNVLLNYVFINNFGYLSAGYTTFVSYLFYTCAHYFVYRRICSNQLNMHVVYDIRMMSIISILLFITGFGIMALYPYPIIRYSIIVFVMMIVILKRNTIINVISSFSEKS